MSSRVAVLGGLGFVGSHLCHALISRGNDVTIFDRLYSSRDLVSDIESRVRIIEADMARTDAVLAAIADCGTVFHLIHTTVPASSMADPGYDIETNVAATARWLTGLESTAVRKIVYVSSGGTVYGVPRRIPMDESHPTDPRCSYGATKLLIEKYLAMLCPPRGVTWRILRPANVYGPGQRIENAQGLVGVLLHRLSQGLPLEVWGDGETRRDYVHISDMVRALVEMLDYEGPENVFNVGTGASVSVNEIISLLSTILGAPIETIRGPAREYDVPDNALDASRLRKETGWLPGVKLEDGLRVLARNAGLAA
jgi:UDP-glucose 4-epimerase